MQEDEVRSSLPTNVRVYKSPRGLEFCRKVLSSAGLYAFWRWRWDDSVEVTPSHITVRNGNLLDRHRKDSSKPFARVEDVFLMMRVLEQFRTMGDIKIVTEGGTAANADAIVHNIQAASYVAALGRVYSSGDVDHRPALEKVALSRRPIFFASRQAFSVPVIQFGIGLFLPLSIILAIVALAAQQPSILIGIIVLVLLDLFAIIVAP